MSPIDPSDMAAGHPLLSQIVVYRHFAVPLLGVMLARWRAWGFEPHACQFTQDHSPDSLSPSNRGNPGRGRRTRARG